MNFHNIYDIKMLYLKHLNRKILKLWLFIIFLFPIAFFFPITQVSTEEHEPFSLNFISSCDLGVTYDVLEYNCYVYVSTNDGVSVIDVHDIFKPEIITEIEVSDGSFSINIKNNTLFIAGDEVSLYNISDPIHPTFISSLSQGGVSNGIAILDHYLFVSNYERVLDIYDWSNPSNLEYVMNFDGGGRGASVYVQNNELYLANPDLGLQVLNISDPTNPEPFQTLINTYGAWDINSFENNLYVGCHGNGVKIFNLSQPTNPKLLCSYNGGGEAQGVSGKHDLLFIADMGDDGVEVLNVSNPKNTYKLDDYAAGDGDVHDLHYNGTFVFVSELKNGLTILEFGIDRGISEKNGIPGYPLLLMGLLLIGEGWRLKKKIILKRITHV